MSMDMNIILDIIIAMILYKIILKAITNVLVRRMKNVALKHKTKTCINCKFFTIKEPNNLSNDRLYCSLTDSHISSIISSCENYK